MKQERNLRVTKEKKKEREEGKGGRNQENKIKGEKRERDEAERGRNEEENKKK